MFHYISCTILLLLWRYRRLSQDNFKFRKSQTRNINSHCRFRHISLKLAKRSWCYINTSSPSLVSHLRSCGVLFDVLRNSILYRKHLPKTDCYASGLIKLKHPFGKFSFSLISDRRIGLFAVLVGS